MNYLYGWNSVAEFIHDELTTLGQPLDGVIVDDTYLGGLQLPSGLALLPASTARLTTDTSVINCLGYRDLGRRVEIGDHLKSLGVLKSFVSSQAKIHPSTGIGLGSVLLGDVLLERSCRIGEHCLLWGGSRVCHNSSVGRGVFMAAGSIVGGGCTVGDESSIGFNSSIREKCSMPNRTKVGANRFWRPNDESV